MDFVDPIKAARVATSLRVRSRSNRPQVRQINRLQNYPGGISGGGSLAISRNFSVSRNSCSGLVSELIFPTFGLPGLLPKLMGAGSYLLVCWVRHNASSSGRHGPGSGGIGGPQDKAMDVGLPFLAHKLMRAFEGCSRGTNQSHRS
jgi:hypothetical protein